MTATPSRHLSESLGRVSSIDALRGLAALSVVLYHARGMFWAGFTETYHRYGLHPDFNALLGYLSVPLSYGSLGVTLFFVLSGYCIHRRGARKLALDPQLAFDGHAFAVRRFWRIYPTYVAALVATALVDAWITARTGVKNSGQDDSFYAFGVSLLTLQGYLACFFGSNGVFWTLAMEVHLYLAYPILFVLSRRYGPRTAVLFALGAGVIYLAADAIFHIEQHLPYRFSRGPIFLPYWFTWAAGFYVAEIEAARVRDFGKAAWLALMSGGAIGGITLTYFNQLEAAEMFWALLFAGFLRWSLSEQGARFWSRRLGVVLAFVGVFSYSLYAVHAPVLHLVHAMVAASDAQKFQTLWPAFGAVGIALLAGWLLFKLVEQWSIRPPSRAPQLKGQPDAA